MFSDTHFHFQNITQDCGLDGVEILSGMAKNKVFFGLDIGTKADDLINRQTCVEKAITQIEDTSLADKARQFMYFSAGIWPSVEEIHNRQSRMQIMKAQINQTSQDKDQDTLHRKIIALGEFGLDHHWNPSGVDGRCESDFDQETFSGEKELFEMQLEYAKELNLPCIIHSRDAFEDTVDCLKNVGYHNGIIHCYSYGLEEAKVFLDMGWYLAFGGGTTYTKKSKMEEMTQLLSYVPSDRFLCETDAPYLAPVPLRGTKNTPLNIEHVYNFIAQARQTSPEELSSIVDSNIKKLFGI